MHSLLLPKTKQTIIGWILRNPTIHTLKMKYSVSGHACIQVVDNIHSQIENSIKSIDVWSPLCLLRFNLNFGVFRPLKHKPPFSLITGNCILG
ncbi:Uncharacterized protein FWK35_00003311 [Aphis craccivora]|uniref:Uncharacterized protein n=1 Tax=Aphis craccivora TaxID=307492 RepID=A0A6G0YTF2_APHCR|nr:Uncharacterized protein FWK35_00003311 [Aphis craccivora]